MTDSESRQELSENSTLSSSVNVTLSRIIRGLEIEGSNIIINRKGTLDGPDATVGADQIVYVKSVQSGNGFSFDGGDYVLGYNFDNNQTVNAGDYGSIGSYIYNEGSNVSLNMSDYDDAVINNAGNNLLIDTKDGNDVIFNGINPGISDNPKGHNVTINSGAGDDLIDSCQYDNVLINAGEGNDRMRQIIGHYITVNGGSGDDDIDYFLVSGGEGYSQLNGAQAMIPLRILTVLILSTILLLMVVAVMILSLMPAAMAA